MITLLVIAVSVLVAWAFGLLLTFMLTRAQFDKMCDALENSASHIRGLHAKMYEDQLEETKLARSECKRLRARLKQARRLLRRSSCYLPPSTDTKKAVDDFLRDEIIRGKNDQRDQRARG